MSTLLASPAWLLRVFVLMKGPSVRKLRVLKSAAAESEGPGQTAFKKLTGSQVSELRCSSLRPPGAAGAPLSLACSSVRDLEAGNPSQIPDHKSCEVIHVHV